MRIAAFGFRSLPPKAGAAGADKFVYELLPRLAEMGAEVTAYTRTYSDDEPQEGVYKGVRRVAIKTTRRQGFDTLLHSAKATWHIIRHNTADIVHIQNGGNSIFALILRLSGRRTFISQDGPDWLRSKWTWYAKLYLWLSQYVTAFGPTNVIFDNIFAQKLFADRFGRDYCFVPFGADVAYQPESEEVLRRLGLEKETYLLFVGRFIPDKGLHYLIEAFEKFSDENIKLVLVGGSPNPGPYETTIRATEDERIIFPGFIYGAETHALMKNSIAYIQPSDVEGLSPVILEASFLGAPIICSDIEQNKYILEQHGFYFKAGNAEDLLRVLETVVADQEQRVSMALAAQQHVTKKYSWETVTQEHADIFFP